jgi:hypothetical protein
VGQYDVKVSGRLLVFVAFVNDQDNVTGKKKKFFHINPNPTPVLFGYKHYHGIYNSGTERGWICHCRLVSYKAGAEGSGEMLWEIWETRCDRPRTDGTTISDTGQVTKRLNIEKWLIDNDLSCDLMGEYDAEFFQK